MALFRLFSPPALLRRLHRTAAHASPLAVQFRGLSAASRSSGPEPDYGSGGYQVYSDKTPLSLDGGDVLPELDIAYEVWGEFNSDRSNVIFLHTGMSASSHAKSTAENPNPGWWEAFIGPGRALDTNQFAVVCSNNLGGCFGSTGPSSYDPRTGQRYAASFPFITVQDMVRAQFRLLDALGIEKVHASVGASLGGMQSLTAAAMFPHRVNRVVSISACARTYPGTIALRHVQRAAIMADPKWRGGNYYDTPEGPPDAGTRLARQIGTITYRSGTEWINRFGRLKVGDASTLDAEFEIERYLEVQGDGWVNKIHYDANSLIVISRAMDNFTLEHPSPTKAHVALRPPDLVRGTSEMCLRQGLAMIVQPTLVMGVQTDALIPCWQQKKVAKLLKECGNNAVTYYELDAPFGHDTFLLDLSSVGSALKGHLERNLADCKAAKATWSI